MKGCLSHLDVVFFLALFYAGKAEQILELINQVQSDQPRLARTLTHLVNNDQFMQLVDITELSQPINGSKGKQIE